MTAASELDESAQILYRHRKPPVPIYRQTQVEPQTEISDAEQALELRGTTVLVCGAWGARRLPLADIATEACASDENNKAVVVIDKFDLIQSEAERNRFANFVKMIAERRTSIRFAFLGVSDSVRELLRAHESFYDYVDAKNSCLKSGSDKGAKQDTRTDALHPVYLISEALFLDMLSDPTFARSVRYNSIRC
jgi:hypothetical protein